MSGFVSDIKGKPFKEESFIEKNCKTILENIEPLTIEQTEIASLFNKDDLEGIKKFGGRRERADYFLELCKKLPKENKDIVCAYMERNFSWPPQKSSHEELCKLFFA